MHTHVRTAHTQRESKKGKKMLECFYWLLGNQTLLLIQVRTVFEIHVSRIETMIYQ